MNRQCHFSLRFVLVCVVPYIAFAAFIAGRDGPYGEWPDIDRDKLNWAAKRNWLVVFTYLWWSVCAVCFFLRSRRTSPPNPSPESGG